MHMHGTFGMKALFNLVPHMSCGITLSPLSSQHYHPQETYICEATLASGKKSLLFA